MRDEELDLIAALASGDLDEAGAVDAATLLARGGAYREEYDAQRRALEMLADIGSAQMTDIERARMRRAVLAEVSAPATRSEPRTLRWLRPLAVAAATVVVVGFGGLMFFNSGRGDMAAEEFQTFDAGGSIAATSTTGAASESAPVAGADTEDIAPSYQDATLQRNITTEGAAQPLDLGSINSREIDEAYLTQIYLLAAQYTVDEPGSLDDTRLSCAPAAGELSDEPLLAFGTAEYDGQPAQYFGFASRRLLFLDATDCSFLGEHP